MSIFRKLALVASPVFQHVSENGGCETVSNGAALELNSKRNSENDKETTKKGNAYRARSRNVLISMQNVELVLVVGRQEGGGERGGCARGSLVFSICSTGKPYTDDVQPVETVRPGCSTRRSRRATEQTLRLALRLFVRGSHRRCESVGVEHYRTPGTRVPCVVSCVLFARVVALHVA